MLLDEPFNGLDADSLFVLRALLLGLAERSGITILLSSHNLLELDQLTQEFFFIENQRITAQHTTAALEEVYRQRYGRQQTNLRQLDLYQI